MSNRILTPDVLAKETLAHLENGLGIAAKVHTDYSKEFTDVGDTINVKRPPRFVGQKNNLDVSGHSNSINEAKFPIEIKRTTTVPFTIDPKDRTLSVSDEHIQDHYIAPAVTTLKESVEADVAQLGTQLYNFVGTAGSGIKTTKDLAAARVALTNSACPDNGRCAFHSPDTSVELSENLKNVFPEEHSKLAIEQAKIAKAAGFMNYESTFLPWHTVGNYGGTPLVDGASQAVAYDDPDTVDSTKTVGDTDRFYLDTNGWSTGVTGLLKKGDVITIAGVYAVNPVSKLPTGHLRTFVLNEDANSDGTGDSRLNLSPALITTGAHQTVDAAPADGAVITVKTGAANSSHRQSLAFHKNAFTLVTRPLNIPTTNMSTKTIMGNKVAISVTEWGDPKTLEHNYRLDILYDVHVNHALLGCRITE